MMSPPAPLSPDVPALELPLVPEVPLEPELPPAAPPTAAPPLPLLPTRGEYGRQLRSSTQVVNSQPSTRAAITHPTRTNALSGASCVTVRSAYSEALCN